MSQKRKTKYHVRKRLFLNRDEEYPAFIIGIVEDTSEIPNDDDDWKWGSIELKMGDCYRHISFDFNMDTKENRANSLYKINRIAEVVNAVRDAIQTEADSINNRPQTKKKNPKVKNTG
ncbi:MAG TPA: hypothetical protein VF596_08150 [Pyrinomonadaceae bacterium]|jgi:hypothetical protein